MLGECLAVRGCLEGLRLACYYASLHLGSGKEGEDLFQFPIFLPFFWEEGGGGQLWAWNPSVLTIWFWLQAIYLTICCVQLIRLSYCICEQVLNGTRIVSNQLGYVVARDQKSGFRIDKVVEVPAEGRADMWAAHAEAEQRRRGRRGVAGTLGLP
jgi:hypothetical protein